MNRSRKTKLISLSRPEISDTNETDVAGYERKIRSLLDTNRLLARENQFLSQQFDMLRKEHDALGHMMRSRIALSNVKEMELKSALEGMRLVVQEKEKAAVSLERKYEDLLAKMKSLEEAETGDKVKENSNKDKEKTSSNKKSYGIRRLSKQFTTISTGEEDDQPGHPQSPAPDGMTEAYHPWLSPVLMRLETLGNDHGTSYQALCSTKFTPMQELEETTDAPDTLEFCGLDDAISCTGDCQTPKQYMVKDRVPLHEESNATEFASRLDTSIHTPASAVRSSLRRRNIVNYALPSVRSKLRQGDPNTFGNPHERQKSTTTKMKARVKK